MAITGDGTRVESWQYQHYAGGARHLGYDLVQQILLGHVAETDAELVAEVLGSWNAVDVAGLRRQVWRLDKADRNEVKRRWGRLAPLVTAHAESSRLADAVLGRIPDRTATGALLVAGDIGEHEVGQDLLGQAPSRSTP